MTEKQEQLVKRLTEFLDNVADKVLDGDCTVPSRDSELMEELETIVLIYG